jgi:hypothetical protein
MYRYKIGFVLSFLFFILPAGKANDRPKQDAGLWTNICVAPRPFAGKWKTLYSLEYRSQDNFRNTSLWCGMVNADYIINQYVEAGVGYEFFLNKEVGGGFSPEYRYYPEVVLSYSWGKFSGSFRARVMNTFTQWNDPNCESRNRLKLAYAIKRTPLKLFAGVEPYHAIYPEVEQRFVKIRYVAGCTYSFGNQKLDLYYLRENYLRKAFERNVLEIDFNYAF